MIEFIILLLLIFMIVGALFVIEMDNLLSTAVVLGTIGIGLSVAFLFLGAPDLAIVEIVVDVISLIVLIRATINRDIKEKAEESTSLISRIPLLVIVVIFFIFTYNAFQHLPAFGNPLFAGNPFAPSNIYLRDGFSKTGASNIVAAIILDFRAYDTFGEAIVLFTSIIGALSVLRIVTRKRKEDKDQ